MMGHLAALTYLPLAAAAAAGCLSDDDDDGEMLVMAKTRVAADMQWKYLLQRDDYH